MIPYSYTKYHLKEYTLNSPQSESFTPLKTNMFPENQWLEDVFPTKIVPF